MKDIKFTKQLKKDIFEYYACFPISIINAHKYYGQKCLSLKKLIKMCKCLYGGVIIDDEKECIKKMNRVYFKFTKNIDKVLRHNGIITIMHPKYNLHSAFCFYNAVKEKYCLVNSLLDSKVVKEMTEEQIKTLLPKHKTNNNHWYVTGVKS